MAVRAARAMGSITNRYLSGRDVSDHGFLAFSRAGALVEDNEKDD